MAIAVKLDDLLHDRRMTLTELADRIGMTLANLSNPQDRQGARDPLLDARGHLRTRSRASPATFSRLKGERAERGATGSAANGARADERREAMTRSCRSTIAEAVSPSFSAPGPVGEEGRDHAPPQRAAVRLRHDRPGVHRLGPRVSQESHDGNVFRRGFMTLYFVGTALTTVRPATPWTRGFMRPR